MIPNDYVPLLFTEVVGQISCFYHSAKDNCPQKVTILDDFDFFKVGLPTDCYTKLTRGWFLQNKNGLEGKNLKQLDVIYGKIKNQ